MLFALTFLEAHVASCEHHHHHHHHGNKHDEKKFNIHHSYKELEDAIHRIRSLLCEHKDEMAFQVLELMIMNSNVLNLRAKEWCHEAPVSKLLKYDLPLTFMCPTDPMVYNFMKMKSHLHCECIKHKHKISDEKIRELWNEWESKFNEKSELIEKIRGRFIAAFEIDESDPRQQWIRHHLHSLICFNKCFWEHYENTERICHLARAMLALYVDNIKDAKKHFEEYKKDELKRLPECKKK